MNKQSFITILLTMLMSMTGTKAFAHDMEVANNDGITIYYHIEGAIDCVTIKRFPLCDTKDKVYQTNLISY